MFDQQQLHGQWPAMNLVLTVVTVSGSISLSQGCPAIMIVAAFLRPVLTSSGRYCSSVLGLKSIYIGTFFSGTMNADANPPVSNLGENLAALNTASARSEATSSASGLREQASGTRGSGLGRSMTTSLERLPRPWYVARVVVSHLLGKPMRGCTLFYWRWEGM